MQILILKAKRSLAPRRAVAILLSLAALSSAAGVGGCAGSSGDYWRERPSSQNYMRLPVR